MTDAATKTPEERAREVVEAWNKPPIHEAPKLEDVIAAALRQTELETWLKAAEVRGGIETDWRPIETAPRDGTIIDLWVPESDGGYRVADCYWSEIDGRWRQVGDTGHPAALLEPSHWLPLPPPPAAARR